MFLCCECCALSGRVLYDGLIIRSEESYRLWRVVVCDHETSQATRLKPARGLYNTTPIAPGEKKHLHNLIFLWPCIMSWLYINYQLDALILFIYKILFASTCFEPQVLIFRRVQLYICSIWYYHSLWEFLVACRYTAWVRTQAVYRQTTRNSHREWQYHRLHVRVYNCILLKMSTWGSKYVEENNILWINNNQCIKLVISV